MKIKGAEIEEKDKKLFHDLLPILLVFSFGGVFGFIYEELFYLVDLGYLVKRGTTFGPWIPIYGFGAVLIVLCTKHLRRNPVTVFGMSMVLCGCIEFLTGFVLFHVLRIRLWDYNNEILNWGNVGGYVCARSDIFFGMSGLFLLYIVYPIILKMQEKFSEKTFICVSLIPACLFGMDIVLSLLRNFFMG